MREVQVKVPDIGDFTDVSVIEVLVKPGDTVRAEQSLVTVESDKASMEIPSSHAGVVKEMKIKLGDTVSEGTVLLVLETHDVAAATAPTPDAEAVASTASVPVSAPASVPAPAPTAAAFGGSADVTCDVLVLGGGPGGYSAAFRAASQPSR